MHVCKPNGTVAVDGRADSRLHATPVSLQKKVGSIKGKNTIATQHVPAELRTPGSRKQ